MATPATPPAPPVTRSEVKRAVATAYAQASTAESNAQRQAAEEWLRRFQVRPEAWAIAHQLLEDPASSPHELFTAATTLHTKISRDFGELNEAAVTVLRATLMKHIMRLSSSKGWKTCVADFVKQLNAPTQLMALLDILIALPQEADSDRVRIHHHARRDFQDQLDSCAVVVIKLIIGKLPSAGSNVTLMSRLVEVVTVWVKLCRVAPASILDTGIIATAFQALTMDALFEIATPLVVELIESYTHPTRDKGVIFAIIPKVMALVPKYRAAKEAEDHDVERDYVRIFSAMGYGYVPLILGEADVHQATLVDLMVDCVDSPTSIIARRDIVDSAMECWFRLHDQFNKMKNKVLKQARLQMLKPAFAKLVTVLLRVSRFPDDFDTLTEDVQHDFHTSFRVDVGDLYRDACTVIGASEVMGCVSALFAREAQQFTASKGAGVAGVGTWQSIEAGLFALVCISKRVSSDEATLIPTIMTFIPSLPPQLRLWQTAISLVGKYAGWLQKHDTHRNQVMAHVVKYLPTPQLQEAAAKALNEVCQACSRQLDESILAVYSHVASLSRKPAVAVIEGLCCVASELPYAKCVAAQQQIALPMVTTLQAFVADPAKAAAAAAASGAGAGSGAAVSVQRAGIDAVCNALVKLTAAVRYITPKVPANVEHPSVKTLQHLLDILQKVAGRFATQNRIVEKLTRLYNHTIRATKNHFLPLVKPLCLHIVAQFNSAPHAGWLYVASTIINRFASLDETWTAYCLNLAKTLANRCFTLFAGGLPAFVQNPDIVEDLFRVLCRCLEEFPEHFLRDPLITMSLKCALVGLELEHKEANRSVLAYLEMFLALGVCAHRRDEARAARLKALIAPVLTPLGPALVLALMRAVLGKLPRNRIDDSDGSLACVLWTLQSLAPAQAQDWMQTAMRTIIPESVLNLRVQGAFLADLSSAAHIDRFTNVLLDLSDEGYKLRV